MQKKWNFREVGNNVTIYDPVVFINPEKISLKNNVIISEFAYLAAGLGLYVGNFIHIAAHSCISGGGYCVLEDFVGICAGTRIITGTDDISGNGIPTPTIPNKYRDKYRSYYKSFVHCKRHSFLGTNVVVNPGVTIGEGSVIGSGSVVTKDVEPWSVYIGSPAIKVKDRPKKKILEMEPELYKDCGFKPSSFINVIKKIHEV